MGCTKVEISKERLSELLQAEHQFKSIGAMFRNYRTAVREEFNRRHSTVDWASIAAEQELDHLQIEANNLESEIYSLEARAIAAEQELAHLQIEVANLRGLKPEIPPMPGEDWPRELPRYGLRWNGHNQPTSVPYKDGYWTPWYLANRLYAELERERKAAKTACENWGEMKQERDQLKAKLGREEDQHMDTVDQRDMTEQFADRLASGIAEALGIEIGEHSSANNPWNNAFFAIDEFNLAQHDVEVIERFLATEAPRIDAGGPNPIDPELHHCEWALHQERERLHAAANQLRHQAKESEQ